MEFQILGPLEVRHEGAEVALGPGKQRALLAILLIHANELVSSDRLIEELWPKPPRTSANALQVYVGKLRKALEPERTRGAADTLLMTRAPGYILRTEPDELDAYRFERLLIEGRAASEARDHANAARGLRQALELWRGPALADFTYDPFAQTEIARLEELRLDAVGERVEADLALGKAADLVGELETLIRDHPLHERLRGQLMLALYRSGRQADALETYRQACKVLDEQLGLAPSRPLERLQTAILRREPALEVSIEVAAAERPTPMPAEAAPASAEVRKTVTVLMARRHGIRGLDPEALSGEDQRYSAEVARTVGRYGGTITSSVGGAVIAVFGVPRVHEDDPFRAVSAALEIRATPRLGKQSRPTRRPASASLPARSLRAVRVPAQCRSSAKPSPRRVNSRRRRPRGRSFSARRASGSCADAPRSSAWRPGRGSPGGFATSRTNGRRSAR